MKDTLEARAKVIARRIATKEKTEKKPQTETTANEFLRAKRELMIVLRARYEAQREKAEALAKKLAERATNPD